MRLRVFMGAAAALLLAGCAAEEQASAVATPEVRAADGELAAAREEAEAHWPQEELPDFATAVPISGFCSDVICETMKVEFARRDWPLAWQGDLDAQRNVATCLATGCNGAVQVDQTSACAWQGLLVAKNPEHANDIDASNLQSRCGSLTDAQRQLAVNKSEALEQKIYGT